MSPIFYINIGGHNNVSPIFYISDLRQLSRGSFSLLGTTFPAKMTFFGRKLLILRWGIIKRP